MKKTITIITLIIGFALTTTAAKEKVKTPVQVEFANKLVSVFGGEDQILSEAELIRVVEFLQANLPEKAESTSFVNRLSRENNYNNAARGLMTLERISIREDIPEKVAGEFIRKYDSDKDLKVNNDELAIVLGNIIGTPTKSDRLVQGSVAKN